MTLTKEGEAWHVLEMLKNPDLERFPLADTLGILEHCGAPGHSPTLL